MPQLQLHFCFSYSEKICPAKSVIRFKTPDCGIQHKIMFFFVFVPVECLIIWCYCILGLQLCMYIYSC